MVAIVGDVIQGVREQMPDPAPTLASPTINTAAGFGSGFTLTFGAYFLVATIRNNFGETLPSAEVEVTTTAGQGIQVNLGPLPFGAIYVRVYYSQVGGGTGNETQYTDFPVVSTQWGLPTAVTVTAAGSPGTPPTRNTAYNPDLDGQFISASGIFRWLNRGLFELSRTCGGIRDYAGVQAMAGQPLYVLPSNWIAITDIWYAGYWMQGGQRGNFFRANKIIAQILTSATVSVQDNRTILEVYPQPANSGGTSTLTAPMGLTDTVVNVANPGFVSLAFGFCQVDSEIMAYAATATGQLTGLIRGLGGNIATTHQNGATIVELNLVINGRRVFNAGYQPGQSSLEMPVPPGWADILIDFVLAQARRAEQDNQTADSLMKSFYQKTAEWARSNMNAVKRRQIGPASVPEAYYGGVPGGGGWIIP